MSAATDILKRARDLIADPKDWRQGLESETNPGRCAGQAIYEASGFDGKGRAVAPEEWRLIDAAREALRAVVGTDCIVVFEIRRCRGTATLGQIAMRFGVGKTIVSQIIRRKSWRHVPEVTS